MTNSISIGVLVTGFEGMESRVEISGQPDSDAIAALEAAITHTLGRHLDRDTSEPEKSMFVLEEMDYDEGEPLGWDLLTLPASLSFTELRAIVGPDDFSTRLRLRGFGGDGFFGLILWELSDLFEFGRDAVETYGAFDLARRMGRAVRRRARRESRRAADAWFHNGGPVPQQLLDVLEQKSSWSVDQLAAYLQIDRSESRVLMKACGYIWSPDGRYVRPADPDAVN